VPIETSECHGRVHVRCCEGTRRWSNSSGSSQQSALEFPRASSVHTRTFFLFPHARVRSAGLPRVRFDSVIALGREEAARVPLEIRERLSREVSPLPKRETFPPRMKASSFSRMLVSAAIPTRFCGQRRGTTLQLRRDVLPRVLRREC